MRSIPLRRGLRLEPASVGDARELFELVDANRDHLRPWLPWIDATRRVADTRRYLRRVVSEARRGTAAPRVYLIRLSGKLVGSIGFVRLSPENRKTEIGYWLARAHCGKGIMTAACRRLLREAFGPMALNRVEIVCATGNRSSRGVPRRLGFRCEGVQRQAGKVGENYLDLAVYSCLRTEWRRPR